MTEPESKDTPEFTREEVFAVLRAIAEGEGNLRASAIARTTKINRGRLKDLLFMLNGSGLTLPLPSFGYGEKKVESGDIAVYRLTDRGDAFVLAGCSFDNPYERALDKIEFEIDKRTPNGKGRAAYIDMWEILAGLGFKEKENVRIERAGRTTHPRPNFE